MKKIIKSIIASVLAFSFAAPAFAATFPDLTGSKWDWARSYIEEMTNIGLINGYEDGTYRPDNSVTKQETLALFARAMGSSNKDNKELVDLAVKQYGSLLDSYSIYAKEEVAFLLYRGALRTSELDTYLKGSIKDEPMKRYEAAIIITKALGDEKEAKNSVLTDLEYTDSLDIPIDAINYVYHVTKEEIMQGMGDGTFSPNTPVLRSQIAVMLYKSVAKMNLKVETGKLISVDTSSKNITAKDDEGLQYLIGYSDATKMYVEGVATQYKEMPTGVDAIFTYSNDSLIYVDTLSNIPDETVTGIYAGYSNTSNELKISIYPTTGTNRDLTTYVCNSNVAMYYNDSVATIKSFKKDDTISLTVSRGKVTSIIGGPKETVISNATVEAITLEPNFSLTISHADDDYDGQTYQISENVTVKKNNETSSFRDIYTGDKVTLTLEYDKIVKVVATSTTKTVEGSIQSIAISANPTITVKVNNQEVVYEIPKSVEITVNDKEATLYDLRVGDTVKLKIESQAVTSIATITSTSTAKQVNGIITAINTSYGFVTVSTTNSDGSVSSETVFAKSDVLVVNLQGAQKSFKNLVVGQTISVTGTVKNGAFDAAVITIMSE